MKKSQDHLTLYLMLDQSNKILFFNYIAHYLKFLHGMLNVCG